MADTPLRKRRPGAPDAVESARAAVRAIQTRLDLILAHELPVCLGARGDFGCLLGDLDTRLYVETERPGQSHPTTNVVKYWPWLEEEPNRRLVLVQLFLDNQHRRRLTTWIAERMKREFGERFRYLSWDVHAGTGLDAAALDQIAAAVAAAARW